MRADLPTETEQRGFTRALVLSHAANPRPVGPDGRPFFNPIFWVVEKEGDLPDWFVVGNPRLRHIPVPRPDHTVRRVIAAMLSRKLPEASELTPEQVAKQVTTFVESTEGLLVSDLAGIAQLCRTEGLKLAEIGEAVRRYKLGVTEDPWRQVDRARLQNAEDFIRERVKGQAHAVTHMLDLIKRAVSGLASREGGGGRPRGVAFLAGPTGVGKTELAKTITELLFGDEAACIRFDMSEFSSEHSDQRLIGAPPGYVGYDVGGELTNAVRQRPFSVVLFDEIEKAHPRILDKFLQVLDDGVLTSGRGERVYFSEAFLILPRISASIASMPPESVFPTCCQMRRLKTCKQKCAVKSPAISSSLSDALKSSTASARTSLCSTSFASRGARDFLRDARRIAGPGSRGAGIDGGDRVGGGGGAATNLPGRSLERRTRHPESTRSASRKSSRSRSLRGGAASRGGFGNHRGGARRCHTAWVADWVRCKNGDRTHEPLSQPPALSGDDAWPRPTCGHLVSGLHPAVSRVRECRYLGAAAWRDDSGRGTGCSVTVAGRGRRRDHFRR